MSIFKCPMGVLNLLESIRQNFFNGVANSDKILALIGWKKVFASMKNGGLGVSSFFALNRALLFKWIWRFISHGPSLWSHLLRPFMDPKALLIILISFLDALLGSISSVSSKVSLLKQDKQVTVASKLRDTSLVSSFRRAPRGGIEEEHLWLLDASLGHIFLP
ncbi:hypothetical protein Tco_1436495 [Tanacetum coccineum]